jgi:hypothetical protein
MARVYRFRVVDSTDGSELARWDASMPDDEAALREAVNTRIGIGIMVDEVRAVDGEFPIEADYLARGQWRTIEILREVGTA